MDDKDYAACCHEEDEDDESPGEVAEHRHCDFFGRSKDDEAIAIVSVLKSESLHGDVVHIEVFLMLESDEGCEVCSMNNL